MNEQEIKIHDIKDIVEIPDTSIFIFSILIFVLISIIIFIVSMIIKYFKNKKTNDRKLYFKILENIDYSNSKEAAYIITKSLRHLSRSDRDKKLSLEIIEELEKYKYKRNVDEINLDMKVKISTFMDSVDV